MKGMIGKKVGMTQIFDEQGNVIPVTVIQAGPCHVTQIRSKDKEGYVAVQLGFSETKPQRLTKGQLGHLKRNNLPALRVLREFRIKEGDADVQEGDQNTLRLPHVEKFSARVCPLPIRPRLDSLPFAMRSFPAHFCSRH